MKPTRIDTAVPGLRRLLLVALTAIGPVSFQMFLPALPTIPAHFGMMPKSRLNSVAGTPTSRKTQDAPAAFATDQKGEARADGSNIKKEIV